MSREFDDEALDALEVVIPNLNWRYSGGTAVNRTIAPLIAKRWRAAWCGPDRPDGVAALSLGDLVRLRFRPPAHGKVRIWHARRNVEMLAGLFLNLLGYRFALIFNSASQRKKTWLTHFLIARMDAVIATSEIAAQFLRRPATVILHGIDVDLYSPPADRLAAFAEDRPARKIWDRNVRPRAAAERQRPVRRGDVPPPAALSGFLRRGGRAHDRRQSALCRRAQAARSPPRA